MVAKAAIVGIVILIIGLIVGAYAAYTPVTTQVQKSTNLLSTSLRIDPNDYESQNVQLASGQIVNVAVSLTNQTVLFVYIMNESQYYNFYGCAPFCRGAPNGSAAFVAGAGTTDVPLATEINISSVTTSNPYKANFTAPAVGTYYFVFDNSMGPSYTTYINQSASGFTLGQFSLVSYGNVPTEGVNWTFLITGVVLLIVGGAIATAAWESKPKRKTPPVATTSVPPATSPPAAPTQ